jgi:type IV secretory pathway TraG/TraD family ATPase VirD4
LTATAADRRAWVEVLEGETLQVPPRVVGAEFDPNVPPRAVVEGADSAFRFDEALLAKHVLFLGSIGSGKTNAMQQLFASLRENSRSDDVFVVFDTKGDFLERFFQPGDRVVTNDRAASEGRATWNIFEDLYGDGAERVDEAFEIASTIFGDELAQAGDNFFFAAGARDVFAAVLEAMARGPASQRNNRDLRAQLESSQAELWELVRADPDLAGVRHYLAGEGNTAKSILAFLQQAVRASFSGVFREAGDFSVRRFVQEKGARALFIEYDIAKGSVLLPIYRVLLDLTIKEALGRSRSAGSVFFLMDEFALLPELKHISDGINFGRALGLKFIAGSQNVSQVNSSYGTDMATSILSGFGTVFAFRLMDATSREFVRERFGRNRKRVTIEHAVRSQGVQENVLDGNVIEDWDLSSLTVGQTIASPPEGPPFWFRFRFRERS